MGVNQKNIVFYPQKTLKTQKKNVMDWPKNLSTQDSKQCRNYKPQKLFQNSGPVF